MTTRRSTKRSWPRRPLLLLVPALLLPVPAMAQGILGGSDPSVSARAMQMVLGLTVLSLAPGILMTVTSFTRIVVALSLLRSGIGAPGVPPNPIIISLALFLSFFVMAPTVQSAWHDGVAPFNAGKITEQRAIEATTEPFRSFMQKHVRADDVRLFTRMAPEREARAATAGKVPFATLMPAFMISELRRAFEMGFLLLLPFLVIDLAVAAVLMAMGMMMLPPASISLPLKIIFFVLVDGWALVASSLVKSFGT